MVAHVSPLNYPIYSAWRPVCHVATQHRTISSHHSSDLEHKYIFVIETMKLMWGFPFFSLYVPNLAVPTINCCLPLPLVVWLYLVPLCCKHSASRASTNPQPPWVALAAWVAQAKAWVVAVRWGVLAKAWAAAVWKAMDWAEDLWEAWVDADPWIKIVAWCSDVTREMEMISSKASDLADIEHSLTDLYRTLSNTLLLDIVTFTLSVFILEKAAVLQLVYTKHSLGKPGFLRCWNSSQGIIIASGTDLWFCEFTCTDNCTT